MLLACDIPEKIEEMYRLAEEIKLAFYGNRIVMFAPLYLSNYCVNGCVYCPYHAKNTPYRTQKADAGGGARARLSRFRIWVTSALPLRPERTR